LECNAVYSVVYSLIAQIARISLHILLTQAPPVQPT
jgi:hypothetical protein